MRRLWDFLERIHWRDPRPADIVVFDREGSGMLRKAVLDGLPCEVLECRLEILHVGPRVLWACAGALKHIDWRWVRACPAGALRALSGEIFKIYLFGCLGAMKPRVVLTYIDNNPHFMWLSRNCTGAVFYAVQNGVRSALNLIDEAPPSPHFAHVMDFPNFFCFGDYERDLYQRLGQRVDRFIPVGSLRADWYRTRVSPGGVPRRFDLCLVSQWLVAMLDGGPAFPDIQQSLRILDGYLVRYVGETGASLCIALRSNAPEERAYFERTYGPRATLVAHDAVSMASYRAIDESEVALSMDSTILREAYGWGKKTLFCNYSGREVNRSSPVVPLCYLDECGYDSFKERLLMLLDMDRPRYRTLVEANAAWLMRWDDVEPSYVKIRKAVLEACPPACSGGPNG